MATSNLSQLTASGHKLDTSPDHFGTLRSSIDIADDMSALKQRMEEDGYLFLPGYLDRDEVMEARRVIIDQMESETVLDPDFPPMDAVLRPGAKITFRPDLASQNEPLNRVLYSGRLMEFYQMFLNGPVRHFDYTWLRTVGPGKGTAPHGDSVFMNRGTSQLYTAWVPLGDVTYDIGGLMILENSHRLEELKRTYGQKDVDSYCENHDDAAQYASGAKWWNGALSDNPFELREQLGLRWLTSEFHAGDLLTFTLYTLHGSLDNQSNRVRISSDSRYQLASEPIDERWIGANPIGHGPAGKRGQIC